MHSPSPRELLRTRGGFTLRCPAGALVSLSPVALQLRARDALPLGEPVSVELVSASKGELHRLTACPVDQVDGVTELRIDALDPALHREILRVAKAQLLCEGLARPFDADGDAFHASPRDALRGLRGAQLTFDLLHHGRPLRLTALAQSAPGALLLRPPADLPLSEARWSHACAAASHDAYALRGWLRPLSEGVAAFEVEDLRISAPALAPGEAEAIPSLERLEALPSPPREGPAIPPCARVRFGPASRPLVGLLGETEGEGPLCAVVVPPAWGRTKESTALLAQVLLSSAKAAGLRLRVLRFDYADTLGESHQSGDGGVHEATRLRVSSCVADIRAALDLASQGAARVLLVGMSFSGPLCLRVARSDARVSALVQLMGASDIQDLVRMATGGVDYVAEHLGGQSGGLRNVLGLLTDTQRWCEDGLQHGLLRFADALRDAAELRCRLVWVLGEHDAFVNPARVRRLVAAHQGERRRLVQVPCGHVPTRTHEALLSFAPLLQEALGEETPLALPQKEQLEAAIAKEWAQAPRTPLPELQDYWRGYMLGQTEDALGYEVLGLTREHAEMMALQAELLELSPGQVVHDIGGGLGHAIRPLRAAAGGPITLCLYDLVPELLEAARDRAADLDVRVEVQPWDAAQGPPPALDGAERVLLSLFLTVLQDPAAFLRALRGRLRPGAVVVASSICPDADLSKVYVELLRDVRAGRVQPPAGQSRAQLVQAVRDYIDAAAHLLRLAEEGTFRLLSPEALQRLLEDAGFQVDAVRGAFGQPSRAVVVRARAR